MAHSQKLMNNYDENKIEKLKNLVNFFTAISVASIICLTGYVIEETIRTQEKLISVVKFSSGFIFTTLGVLFALSGIATNMRIKKYFRGFYREHRCMLNFATIGLSLPLMIRGALDILRAFDTDIEKLIHDEPALYSSILFIVGDIIPMSFQLSSLIFGYIRKQKDKKYRLEKRHSENYVNKVHNSHESF